MKEEQYSERIGNLNWDGFFKSQDIDVINDMFETKINSVLNDMAPIRVTQRRKNVRKWVSQECKEEMKMRDQLRQVARQTRRDEDWEQYRIARNKCLKLLNKSKNDFYNEMVEKI